MVNKGEYSPKKKFSERHQWKAGTLVRCWWLVGLEASSLGRRFLRPLEDVEEGSPPGSGFGTNCFVSQSIKAKMSEESGSLLFANMHTLWDEVLWSSGMGGQGSRAGALG